jgi:pimeloyl-ACP methyl ester carboxylesterase
MYAGIRPERVRSIASLEGFGLPRTSPAEAPVRQRRWLDELRSPPAGSRYESIAHLGEKLQRRNPRLPSTHAHFIAEAWTIPDPAGGRVARFDPWHRLVTPVLYRREEVEATWRHIAAPVLMLLGGGSEFLGRMAADAEPEAFQAHLTRLTLHTLPGLGHMMHHEDPSGVARSLSDWYTAEPDA